MKKLLIILAFTILITGIISSNAFAVLSDDTFNYNYVKILFNEVRI
jgi:hypothetical protein